MDWDIADVTCYMLLSVQYPRVWTEMRSLFSGLKCWSEVLVSTVGLNCFILVVCIYLTLKR